MTTYTDVFGGETVPPANMQYREVALAADVTLGFSDTTDGVNVLASIMDVTASAGSLSITFPDATTGSTGFNTLVRNLGATTFTLKGSTGSVLATVLAGEAKFLYLADNSTAAGDWQVITFGTGTSSADASALAGAGLKVVTSELALNANVYTSTSAVVLSDVNDRASVCVFIGGAVNCTLPAVATAGTGWYVDIANQGSGSTSVIVSDSATIDGAVSKTLAPGESARFYTDAAAWYTVGYGRSAQFIFTKLVKDVTTGTPFTLTAAEASNKLLQFIGAPSANVTVIVPDVVNIYYVQCAFTGAYSLTLKTSAGTGIALNNSARSILYCDGVNVVDAQTVAASSSLAMLDGSESLPSLYYAADTDTGIYRVTTNALGITAGGVRSATFTSTGVNNTPVGATTPSTGAFTTLTATTPVPVTSGGTGASTAGSARTNLAAEGTANKDASGGYAGLTLFKINFKNALNTFTSFFTNSNTASRTYTFQDRDGTIADNTDLAAKADTSALANYLPLAGGTMTGDITMSGASIIEAEGAAVASATTTDIWATDGNTRHVTGNVTITSFGTAPQAGARMKLVFDGTPQLTQSANLNLNAGGSNITIEAGDWAEVYADTTTQHNVVVHRKSGVAIVGGVTNSISQLNSSVTVTDAGTGKIETTADGTIIEELTLASRKSTIDGGTTLYPEFKCRAWVNFNGTGTVAIRASGNVTSITDNGTGDYTVNFTTAMPDANYSAVLSLRNNPAGGSGANASAVVSTSTAQTSSSIRVTTGIPTTGTLADYDTIFVNIFR